LARAIEEEYEQSRKNKSATPKYTVYTDPDSPEEEFMSAWIDKWREHFSYFDNTGCGCCINDYEFDAPQEAIDELPDDLIEVNLYEERNHEERNRPIRTGIQSSFGEFNRSAERLNHKKGA